MRLSAFDFGPTQDRLMVDNARLLGRQQRPEQAYRPSCNRSARSERQNEQCALALLKFCAESTAINAHTILWNLAGCKTPAHIRSDKL